MTSYRIWPSASGPSNADNGDPVTLGTRFTLSATGWVTHLHYWRGTTDDNGTHQGVIYLVSGGTQVPGTLVTFVDSGTGWQTAALAAPVQLSASTMYCVAVFHPNGRPAFTGAYWVLGGPGATGITNGILTAPNSADASGQGVFNGSGSLAHPTGSFNQTNYWNDVTISDVNPNLITPTGIAPTGGVGQPAIAAGVHTITPNGIAPTGGVGTPSITAGTASIAPNGIPPTGGVGQPAITSRYTLALTGIAPTGGTGQPAVTPGTVTVSPIGIAPTGGAGTPALAGRNTVALTGIPPSSGIGQPTLAPGPVTIALSGIAPTGGVGRPRLGTTGATAPRFTVGPPHTRWTVGPPRTS